MKTYLNINYIKYKITMTTIKLESNITVKKKLKDISDNSWNKIVLELPDFKGDNRRKLGFQKLFMYGLNGDNTKLFAKRGNWWAFVSEDVLNETKNVFPTRGKNVLVSIDKMGTQNVNTQAWYQVPLAAGVALSDLFYNDKDRVNDGGNNWHYSSNDFFTYAQYNGKDHGKIKSPEVLKFLKKYCPEIEFNTIYLAGTEVERSEVGIAEPVVPNNPSNPSNPNTSGKPVGKPGDEPRIALGKWEFSKSQEPNDNKVAGKNSLVIGAIGILLITSVIIVKKYLRKKIKR